MWLSLANTFIINLSEVPASSGIAEIFKVFMKLKDAMNKGFRKLAGLEIYDLNPPMSGECFMRELKRPVCREFWSPEMPSKITRRISHASGYSQFVIEVTK